MKVSSWSSVRSPPSIASSFAFGDLLFAGLRRPAREVPPIPQGAGTRARGVWFPACSLVP